MFSEDEVGAMFVFDTVEARAADEFIEDRQEWVLRVAGSAVPDLRTTTGEPRPATYGMAPLGGNWAGLAVRVAAFDQGDGRVLTFSASYLGYLQRTRSGPAAVRSVTETFRGTCDALRPLAGFFFPSPSQDWAFEQDMLASAALAFAVGTLVQDRRGPLYLSTALVDTTPEARRLASPTLAVEDGVIISG